MTPDPIVQDHLRGVARRLAGRPGDPTAATRRAAALRRLADYADAGEFPQNRVGVRHRVTPMVGGFQHAEGPRAPIFVDPRGVHCAVAHVIAGTDPALVARIAARFNEAWLPDMQTEELAAWAAANGLSVQELAEIQPSYQVWIPNCPEEPPAVRVYQTPAADGDVKIDQGNAWACFDGCSGDLQLSFPVTNLGSTAVSDARVDITWTLGGEPSGEVYPFELDGITLEPMTGIVVGPFAVDQRHVGDLVDRADVLATVTSAGDPNAANNQTDGWTPSMVTNPIVASDCPDLSWGPRRNGFDNGPCGCAAPANSVSAAWVSLAVFAARRRRKG